MIAARAIGQDQLLLGYVNYIYIVGVDDVEGPPVPIPNTVVKLNSAENTWLEAAREDRSTPTLF